MIEALEKRNSGPRGSEGFSVATAGGCRTTTTRGSADAEPQRRYRRGSAGRDEHRSVAGILRDTAIVQ